MRLLFVCSAKIWGGNEKWTSMAMKELNKNHKVFLCYRRKELGDKFGKNIYKFTAPFLNLFDPITYIKLSRFIRKKKIDIIISTKKKEYFICGILAKLFRIKNVLRLGIVRKMNFPIWHKLVYNILCDGIIVNAHRIRQNLNKYKFIDLNKIKVIYNGIELKNNSKIPSKTANGFSISSVGMLTKRKGFHLLIESLSKLPQSLKNNIKLNIVGSGRSEIMLKNQVKNLGLQEKVKFWGFMENPLKIVADTDLFVLLSANEGISNALIEAMMIGVPVLTSDAGGSVEFIKNGENGFLTHSTNPEKIAKLLAEIIKNQNKLSEIGKTGCTTVKNLFSPENMRCQLEEFLYEVVDETSS
ncbi:MAG: glycosyltransferase [Candidatus Cloacimonadota bacterium]|nr:glycosyltransferase [Candidatus Cloacimonadota bacterium]